MSAYSVPRLPKREMKKAVSSMELVTMERVEPQKVVPRREKPREAVTTETLIVIKTFPTRVEMRRRRGLSKSSCTRAARG